VGVLVAVPWIDTSVVTASPRMAAGTDLYAHDGALRLLVAVVTLEAGPWQFSILGLFIVLIAVTPALLWAFERGWWLPALALSWSLFALGRTWDADVLPAQSERAFPILVWQALYVHGLALGYHRDAAARALLRWHRPLTGVLLIAAAVGIALRLQMEGLAPIAIDRLLGYAPADWLTWQDTHFDKTTLDLARVAVLGVIGAAVYAVFRRYQRLVARAVGWLLLPLGRNSFYVFIMHVFVCLAVALVPGLAGIGPGLLASAVIEAVCVGVLWLMVQRRFLFSVVPR